MSCGISERRRSDYVPTIDFELLRRWDVDEFVRFQNSITRVGFLQILNHSVPKVQMDELAEVLKSAFALSLDNKESASLKNERGGGVRGYFSIFSENLDQHGDVPNYRGDCKEGFDFGLDSEIRELDFSPTASAFHSPNQWPQFPEEDTARRFTEAVHASMRGLFSFALELARQIARALDIPEDQFLANFKQPCVNFRLLHYTMERETESENSSTRIACGAHSDYGCFTLLQQDATGGLEVEDRLGEWHGVPFVPYALVVNIGDMLAAWSGGKLKSTVHRVVYQRNSNNSHRYSVPYFFNPSPDVIFEPWSDGKMVTCESWLLSRYSKAFAAVAK